ncbi:hypothetical protein [Nocardia alba]|uniref:Uncharacterized protein n=1 Tax=Nocardia alba TaxID=225051 RepID=A0A4R1G2R0_9NOCA|nr:hypothetical protein [Nocardia alba]TCK00931.1 hypothetical protein DFR71_1946 [Nocardia alba]
MGYPYGPQQGQDPYAGQGYAQPGYGPDPYGYAQPYGAPVQNGYGAPVYGVAPYPYGPGYGEPRAGGGTAITAAVIALLLSILGLGVMGVATAVIMGSDATSRSEKDFRAALTVGMLIGAVPCALLLLGSILLFRRKTAGRVILILLSGIGVVFSVLSTVIPLVSGNGVAGEEATVVLIGGAVSGAAPLLIFLLALAPSTGRWIRAGRPGGYPPPGY